jgi:hypothetical protein
MVLFKRFLAGVRVLFSGARSNMTSMHVQRRVGVQAHAVRRLADDLVARAGPVRCIVVYARSRVTGVFDACGPRERGGASGRQEAGLVKPIVLLQDCRSAELQKARSEGRVSGNSFLQFCHPAILQFQVRASLCVAES